MQDKYNKLIDKILESDGIKADSDMLFYINKIKKDRVTTVEYYLALSAYNERKYKT